jgi:hypothetical protein
MKIDVIHSYLVHAGKNANEQRPLRGIEVKETGQLMDMLNRIFFNAEHECQHSIGFLTDASGAQKNECLDDVLGYAKARSLLEGRKLAERLQKVTTHKSGLGLLFLMVGGDRKVSKVVISRFPAEQGILAEESEKTLTVKFLEKVFMKGASSYKSAVFSGATPATDFWKGRAVDKQINNPESGISGYWIRDFLRADFLTPGETATRRFATALRNSINRTSDVAVKDELAAACRLFGGFDRKVSSAKSILSQLTISKATQDVVMKNYPQARLFEESFRFVGAEFSKHLAFKTVELDNGALMTALADEFEGIFEKQPVRGNHKGAFRFSTEGTIVDQRFKRIKQ